MAASPPFPTEAEGSGGWAVKARLVGGNDLPEPSLG